jgi:hypothetical protein
VHELEIGVARFWLASGLDQWGEHRATGSARIMRVFGEFFAM